MSSSQTILRDARVGSVPYLNARPLVHGCRFRLAPPSQLAQAFDADELDAALLSSFFVFERADEIAVVDQVAIAADGDVFSVILAYRGELDSLDRIYLDPASLSSVNLMRVVLPELTASRPQFVEGVAPEGAARVLIGDPAIDFRSGLDASWTVVDLAGAWKQVTGLPFVFAVWGIRRDYPRAEELATALRGVKGEGMAALDEIRAAAEDPAFAKEYLGGFVKFDLTDEAKCGLEEFRRRLVLDGILANREQAIVYI